MHQWWKTKGTQGHFTIDRRIIALDTYELPFENSKKKKVAKKNINSEMKIWKINCWRKVPLELLCLVVEWIKHIKPIQDVCYEEFENLIEKTKHIDQSLYQSDRYLWTSYAS